MAALPMNMLLGGVRYSFEIQICTVPTIMHVDDQV